MASLPLVGSSYALANRNAAIDRAINLYLAPMEVPGKAQKILESVPGLRVFSTLAGEARGGIETNDRAFVVFGATLYEVFSNGAFEVRGTLNTSTGPVSMAYGLFQVVIVDGPFGYVLTLATSALAEITSDAFYGSSVVRFMDNYFLFIRPDTQQFYITAINDASSLDALDFASAEIQPDDLVSLEVDHSELYLFGQYTTEIWFNSGGADFPFTRSQGSSMEVGCMAAHSVRQIDNSIMWLGRDKNGSGIVYRAVGHAPQRISKRGVELALSLSTDLSRAVAFVHQYRGLTFYCLNAPGLTATWCYEVSTGEWHEVCDLDELGQFKAGRGTMSLFAFDKHLVGGSDGVLYQRDYTCYQNGSDPLVRERISPHNATASRMWQFFTEFWLDCTTGGAAQGDDPQVGLAWSDDAGKSWGNFVYRSLGKVGEVFPILRWMRLGRSRDRVWRVRFSDNAPFSINDGGAL